MRAFVTGGTGFLGRRVVQRLLAQGHQVRVLARNAEKAAALAAGGAEIVPGDLSDIDAFTASLAGVDVVVLVGARAVSSGTWEEFVRENVAATEKMIDESVAAGVRRIVYVSSLGIFEIPRDGVTITEDTHYDHQPLLRGNYTRSKIDADRIARAAARSGKPVVIVRPGRIYGHDHPLGQPLYLGRVKKRLPGGFCLVVGKSSYLTPISYVENAADAVVAAATVPGVERGEFNVVDDPDLTHKRYFRAVSRLPGFPRRYLFLPVGLFVPALAVVDFLHRLLRGRSWSVAYQLRRSGRSARYSIDAARERLGWTARVGLEQALGETAGTKS
jgi:nucleoside-diphosphate-sugar epimerase